MSIYILVGPPGSGKGTMAEALEDEFGFIHVSTGDILRNEMAQETELGQKAKSYVQSGELIPDEVIADVVKQRLIDHNASDDSSRAVILDGFPRTIPQAEMLESIVNELKTAIDSVLQFTIDREVLLKRLSGRRICSGCDNVYNIYFSPSEKGDYCEACGAELQQRDDDKEETVKQRLNVYEEETKPLIQFYEERGKLVRIDAGREKDDVFADVRKAIKNDEKA